MKTKTAPKTPETVLTAEQQAEYDYRVAEREGILCQGNNPSSEQTKIAETEAKAAIYDQTN